MSDEPPPPACEEGAPAWVMTFADLMSLLMCFFVLLLAFSEMDALKFKQLAGSMSAAFGVQRKIKAKVIPKGTNIVMKEFSPGKPSKTIINEVRQHTQDDLQRHKEVQAAKEASDAEEGDGKQAGEGPTRAELILKAVKSDADEIKKELQAEVAQGLLDVETDMQRVILRIQEKGAFPSGSASLQKQFEPVMGRIATLLTKTSGSIVIAGHTDNIPIKTARFRSNWELSAARSVTVMHFLRSIVDINESRFLVEGHADSKPLEPNDTAGGRARNRRVEIVIVKGEDIDGGQIEAVVEVNKTEK